MPETYRVAMADAGFAREPDLLETQALGSCVGIVIYDPITKVAGMCHAMLPDVKEARINSDPRPTKFVNSAVEFMIVRLQEMGASNSNLLAKIAGGSNMFPDIFSRPKTAVGDRNIEAAKAELKKRHIKLVAEDTGGNSGRTIIFDTKTSKLYVRIVSGSKKMI